MDRLRRVAPGGVQPGWVLPVIKLDAGDGTLVRVGVGKAEAVGVLGGLVQHLRSRDLNLDHQWIYPKFIVSLRNIGKKYTGCAN